ncbi:MAG: response regulator transcription factor [Bacteroidota bacterium]
MINLLLISDDEKVRQGISYLINNTEGYNCTESGGNLNHIEQIININRPDIIVFSSQSNTDETIQTVRQIKFHNPSILILMISQYNNANLMLRLLRAGANGYLSGEISPTQLMSAVKELYDGGAPLSPEAAKDLIDHFQNSKDNIIVETDYKLSPREKEVLKLLVDGVHIKDIAKKLFISIETVRFHFKNVYRKLKVKNQAELVAKTLREKVI